MADIPVPSVHSRKGQDIDSCIECAVGLVAGENWYPSFVKKNHRKCKTCYDERRLMNRIQREGPKPSYLAQLIKLQGASGFNKVLEGYVYIISNPAWRNWYKVGSSLDAKNRRNTYQTSSPLRDYKLKYCKIFSDRRAAESKIHIALEALGLERSGEWFNTKHIRKIIEVINTEVSDLETLINRK